MKVTVTTYLNRRLNTPQTLPDNKSGYLALGDVIEVAEVLQGQMIEGVDTWLKSTDGNFFWSGGTNYNALTNYANRIVNMPQAWKDSKGKGITVALLDSGITTTHPVLKPILNKHLNLAKSFVPNIISIEDVRGHGTAMAGLVGGIAPACDLLIMKVLDDKGNTIPQALAEALDEMVVLKPKIINLSLGVTQKQYDGITYTKGETIKAKIDTLAANGVLMVATAGNDTTLTDSEIYYMAMNDNVISVGASSSKLEMNKINKSVDFIFYNSQLQTTGIDGGVDAVTKNTSAYTAMVSGIVATLLSVNVVPVGYTVKDFIIEQLETIASEINNFNQPSDSEIIIYKIN
ncbi:S8/S53 family peptidase [Oscillatoria amoena NRMC-F 0135]|nr:S8/S53 family peptidase [Oscillatoria amoena NRMC-F 0135]